MKPFFQISLLILGSLARAQTLSLTAPMTPVTVPDGDEFATSVVHSPWDMNQLRDIPLEAGFASIGVQNGIWTGTSASSIYYAFPLSPGFLRPNYLSYWSWYDNGMPYGPLNKLNANRFSRISFRMSQQQSRRNYVSIFWARQFNRWPAEEGNLITWFDGEPSFNNQGQYVMLPQASGFRIYDIDPTGTEWMRERNPLLAIPPNFAGQPWWGDIYGFYIWPTNNGAAGDTVSFDWIRAYDPVSSPTVTLAWNSTGLGGNDISIQLYLDKDNSGFDGDLFMSGLQNDGSYLLRTAALPPGDYYAYLRAVRHHQGTLQVLATSGYSSLIRVGVPPQITIHAPGFLSGEDYAASELNNPWDFADSSDILYHDHMHDIAYVDGLFRATTNWPVPPALETDALIHLNTRKNGNVVPIQTGKYRYFSFRMRVREEPGYGDIFDKVERGWESRLLWWNQGPGQDGSYSKDIPLLEGWRTYTVDLWDPTFLEPAADVPGIPQRGWRESGSVRTLRFDPMEAHIPTRFWLDFIKLTSENRTHNGQYTISWTAEDPDSDLLAIRIFADRELAQGGVQRATQPIHTVEQSPGLNQWTWTPRNHMGRYLIRIEASDETRTIEKTSRVPVVVGPTTRTIPVYGDYDGDGITDVAVYEPLNGMWYIRPSSGADPITIQWGDASMTPVPGDYNGNGRYDLALYQRPTGNWFIRSIDDGPPITFAQNWGDAGMDPVSGDYNGNGRHDLAVYQRSTGNWFIRALGPVGPGHPPITFGQNWGNSGMSPVSGDYDGDGRSDLAVYERNSGNWFIRRLGPVGPGFPPITFGQNWGDASMDPVPGDYNGNGRHDLAVYQRATGNWFIRALGPVGPGHPPITFGQNWGDASMVPVPGDYNGSGRQDLSVYQPSTGYWFIRRLGSGPPILFAFPWGHP